MPTLKIEIDFDSKVSSVTEDVDGERVILPLEKMVSFITGKLGDLYVKILIPHEDIMMELHAKKSSMMKKGAIFDMMPTSDGQLLVRVKGVFKVDAYSHVAERVKSTKCPYDQSNQTSKIIAQLL